MPDFFEEWINNVVKVIPEHENASKNKEASDFYDIAVMEGKKLILRHVRKMQG
jgi:hypothetical protein